ncbi:hypothetical protein KIN20_011407 [Parelaphostrongylus tenuis]|uniref:Uncharacterized protein n=1 Tax=Parelaphostrongylus tenuis TaxID=148309 RepID=A0AAD5N059_PARTN|nr:hypothetical protein KIN20_011407 [Parelaphostrongylus tenuis]
MLSDCATIGGIIHAIAGLRFSQFASILARLLVYKVKLLDMTTDRPLIATNSAENSPVLEDSFAPKGAYRSPSPNSVTARMGFAIGTEVTTFESYLPIAPVT